MSNANQQRIVAVTMPKWGMEMTEGTVNEWHCQEGEIVNQGANLIDVETSKIINTIEAGGSGVLKRQIAQPGEVFPCGALLAVIAKEGVDEDEISLFIQQYQSGKSKQTNSNAESSASEAPSSVPAKQAVRKGANVTPINEESSRTTSFDDTMTQIPAELTQGPDDSSVPASAIAKRLAKKLGINLTKIKGTGRNGRVSKEDIENAIKSSSAVTMEKIEQPLSMLRATPVAKRLADKHNIDLQSLTPTGAGGRISKEDVEKVIAQKLEVVESGVVDREAGRSSAAMVDLEVESLENETESSDYVSVKMTGMRQTIARRLSASKQQAPHYRVVVDVNLDALIAAREQINRLALKKSATSESGNTLVGKLPEKGVSINDFLIKALATALVEFPNLNAQLHGDEIRQIGQVDISIAVAVNNGLITPILRAAETKSLSQIAVESASLIQRAKAGALTLSEIEGGSFSLSNLGMFGVRQFDAVINLPQVAILAVSAAEKRPIVKNDELAIATMMSLTLSSDHRVVDGAEAAQFMQLLKNLLQDPLAVLV